VERRAEAEAEDAEGELGVGEELPLFYPCALAWHPQLRIRGRDTISFVLSFVRTLFLCDFFGAHLIFLGQAWGGV